MSRPLSATRSHSTDAAGLPVRQQVRSKLGRNRVIGDLWGHPYNLKLNWPVYWVDVSCASKVYRIN